MPSRFHHVLLIFFGFYLWIPLDPSVHVMERMGEGALSLRFSFAIACGYTYLPR